MEPIHIVPGAAKHHDFISSCQIRMALETEDLALDPETVRLGVGAVLLDSNKGRYFVAEDADGAPLACLLTIPEWSDWRNRTVLWIHSLYVLPAHRGRGIYKKLYSFLKEMVRRDPAYAGLRLYVDKRNKKAADVYRKLGMSAEHYELFEWLV
jgi:ribosomal protein S18 acetylase RimI-like enzyme